MKQKKKTGYKRVRAVVCALLACLLLWIIWGNVTVQTHRIDIPAPRVPAAFDGYKIAQVSDLHNASFGKNNARLLRILEREQPDIIALTGDLVDRRHTDAACALAFVKQAAAIAPCYYVTGNHESLLYGVYDELEAQLRAAGVHVLRNETMQLTRRGAQIQLIGLDDPYFSDRDNVVTTGVIDAKLQEVGIQPGFTVVLCHRPEAFDAYVENGVDLALTGHAHGGQIRLPFIGGLYAPNQGFFPQYDAGMYTQGDTHMIVSRGIGNSKAPVRVNDRPEIVIVTLKHTSEPTQ